MLGSTGDHRLVKECWNETYSRTSYIRSQSENPNSSLHTIQLPRNLNGAGVPTDRESLSEQTTSSSFPRNFSDSNPLVCLPILANNEHNNMKLRKTVSSDATRLEQLVAMNSEGNTTPPKPKQEQKGVSNQFLKKGKVISRRASLPASYLEKYLSVNNIRRRAINSATADDSEEGVVSMDIDGRRPSQGSKRRIKNAGRRKVSANSNEELVFPDKEVLEPVVPEIEVDVSVENDRIEDESRPKRRVGSVISFIGSVTVECPRLIA